MQSILSVCFLLLHLVAASRSENGSYPLPSSTLSTPGGYVHLDVPMSNTTKYEGDTLRIKCEITGFPLPRYVWYKDGELLEGTQGQPTASSQPASRVSAKTTPWGSRLKVENVVVDDSGVYTCEGFNRFESQSTNGSVLVKPGSNPNRDRVDDLDENTSESFQGNTDQRRTPQPLQQTSKERVLDKQQQQLQLHNLGKQNADGGNLYTDYGDVNEAYDDVIDEVVESYCQPYHGVACSSYISDKNVYISGRFQQGTVDETISAALSVIASLDSGGGQSDYQLYQCSGFIASALCQFAFPICSVNQHNSLTNIRRLCRSDCLALESDICSTLYELSKTHATVSSQLVLPDCSQLPDDDENCLHIGLPTTDHSVDNRHHCYNATGADYRGTESVSSSGNVCLRWTLAPSAYHHIGDHNYCRNPDDMLGAPWCFTSNNKRDVCAVHKCVSVTLGESQEDSSAILHILVPCLSVPAAVGLLLFIIRVHRQCKPVSASSNKSNEITTRQYSAALSKNNPMELNPMLAMDGGSSKCYRLKCMSEYQSSSIKFLSKLSTGQYGPVYRAELSQTAATNPGNGGCSSSVPVAIKTLSTTANPETRKEFWDCAERQSRLLHPNIVCVIGVCRGDFDCPPGLLFEFAFYGDLHEYLAVHSPHSDIAVVDISGRQQILQHSDMLRIAVQLSAGLEYLSAHHVVHKDIAARTVLVGNMGVVKICDLELGRDAYPIDYYTPPGLNTALPVRWMAPESLLAGVFHVESDIWSFGITLWEIYSYGLQPYFGHTNQDVLNMIRLHQILPCPANCPSQIYSLMTDCWNVVPSSRPSFNTLHRQLHHWVEEADALVTSTSAGSDQSFKYVTSPCPLYTYTHPAASAADPFITFNPYNQAVTKQAISGTVLQSAIGLHSALLNSSNTALRPSMTSGGLPLSVTCHNTSSDSCPKAPTVAGLFAPSYFRHPSDTSIGDTNSVNPSSPLSSSLSANRMKAPSRISNNSSISSTSDCKTPRWPPSVKHCTNDSKSNEVNDVTHAVRL